MNDLKTAILKTMIYFDGLDYPLTAFEVWKFLFWPGGPVVALEAIVAELNLAVQQGTIEEGRGYYFLAGRASLIMTRQERHRLSIKKMARARAEAKRFLFSPGLVGVAVVNSLALRNSRPTGDLDFFLVTAPGQVWESRLFTTAYSAALDKRTRSGKKQDQNCLCVYVSTQALNFEKFLLPEKNNLPDVDFIYWLATLAPLEGRAELWQSFRRANQWLEQYLPNLNFGHPENVLPPPKMVTAGLIERLSRCLELAVLASPLRLLSNTGTAVVYSDEVIKLHQNDGRERIRARFFEQLHAYGL